MGNLKELKQRVYEANLSLVSSGLVISTWGNVSEYDESLRLVAIKPSGVPYDKLTAEDIVVVDMNGDAVEGGLRPSTDLLTHLVLYKEFKGVKAVVHTHSQYGTIWAQAGLDIPLIGTTHADYFAGDIPCARDLAKEEIEEAYELNTGLVIVETFRERGINPLELKAVLARGHAPFVWGDDAHDAVHNAVVLEYIAKMAWSDCVLMGAAQKHLNPHQRKKHYDRKFGANAYYGQK